MGATEVSVKLSGASYSTTDLALEPTGTAHVKFDNKLGFGASVNQHWTNRFSTEFDITSLKPELKIAFPGETIDAGNIDILAISAIAQWHFGTNPRIDPYAGGGAAYVIGTFNPTSDSGVNEDVHLQDELTAVADAGVYFRVTPRTSVGFDARYIRYRPTDNESGDEGRLDINPLVYSVAVRFRF